MKTLVLSVMCGLAIGASHCLAAQIVKPTKEQVAKADYGKKPTEAQLLKKVKEWGHKTLKDPYSARYKISKPKQGWFGLNEARFYGWLFTVEINAKNSYGAYTGKQTRAFVYKQEKNSDDSIILDTMPYLEKAVDAGVKLKDMFGLKDK